MASIFISYARRDGSALAQRLSADLKTRRHDPWLDTERLTVGRIWSRELADALDRCDLLIAILSAAAYDSSICYSEQLWALDRKKLVIPVLAHPATRRPVHLYASHYLDLSESGYNANFPQLLRAIASPKSDSRFSASRSSQYSPPNDPKIPPRPAYYVERPEALNLLRAAVLNESEPGRIAMVAAQGMGGIGKTVLASMLARDPLVKDAFRDGIFWVSVGQDQAAIQKEHASLLGRLGVADTPSDDYTIRERLQSALADKAILLIVDDVWELEDAEQFVVDAPLSRILFTTRKEDVVLSERVGAELVPLAALKPDEALKLLGNSTRIPAEQLPKEKSRALLVECGFLPLAIETLGTLISRKGYVEIWDEVLRDMRASRLPDRALRAVETSVVRQPEHLQERYRMLAVFPGDVGIPVGVLSRLWRVPEEEARATMAEFRLASLATIGADGTLRQHDLQRYFCIHSMKDGLAALHRDFIGNYHPPDAWYYSRRAYHLYEAGEYEALRRILLDPEWILESLRRNGVSETISDYDFLSQDQDLSLIRDAMLLASHVLRKNPDQGVLAGQLIGRLAAFDSLVIRDFLDLLRKTAGLWLEPATGSLTPPGGPLLRTLQGHSSPVSAVAVTPDSQRAVSASWDQTLKVWDLVSGRELLTFRGHSGSVDAVAVTPDGRRAVSASSDKTLKVWELASGRELRTLRGHSGPVTALAVTPDGRRAVSASDDETLKVWDLVSGRELRTLRGHSSYVNAVAVTPDGHRAVSASDDKTLKLWDLTSGRELRTLRGRSNYDLTAVAVTPDGLRILSASLGVTLNLWDLVSGRELRTLQGHSGSVTAVAVTPDSQRAVSASDDKTLKLWDLASGRALRTLRGHSNLVSAVALTPDGQRAVSASHDHTLKVWDLASGREPRTIQSHSEEVNAVAVTPDGDRAISASHDRTVKVWDLASGRELRTLQGHSNWVNAVAVTQDGQRAVSASYDQTLKVWKLASGRNLRTLRGNSSLTAVAVTPDGQRAVSASYDQTLKVWDLTSGRNLRTLRGHSNLVSAVALTPDGQRAVSASHDHTLKVWDLTSGRELRTLRGHSGPVCAVAVTQDGQRAVSASSDQTLKVWDLASGRELRTLQGHSDRVNAVVLTQDGRGAISASAGQTLKVWDLASGAIFAEFIADAPLHAVAITPDARTIIAGDDLGRMHFLRVHGL